MFTCQWNHEHSRWKKFPLPRTITSSAIIHGAMDNVGHNENTLAGKGLSHDTILMVFQKLADLTETDNVLQKSVIAI